MKLMLAQAALLAQRGNQGPFGGGNKEDQAVLMVILVVMGIVLVITLVVYIFFLLTLSKALGRVAPENRTMEPGMVWLNLVPCLSLVWQFITVNRVAESLDNEFYDRGIDDGEDYGKGIGTTACVLNLLGIIPYIGGLFGLGALVCGIIYWVKIAGYSKQLAEDGGARGGDDYDDRAARERHIGAGPRPRPTFSRFPHQPNFPPLSSPRSRPDCSGHYRQFDYRMSSSRPRLRFQKKTTYRARWTGRIDFRNRERRA